MRTCGPGVRTEPADTVLALIAPNCPEFTVVFHAVIICGCTISTVNPGYDFDEIRLQLILAAGVIVVTMPRFAMEPLLELIQCYKVTRFFAVPPVTLTLVRYPC